MLGHRLDARNGSNANRDRGRRRRGQRRQDRRTRRGPVFVDSGRSRPDVHTGVEPGTLVVDVEQGTRYRRRRYRREPVFVAKSGWRRRTLRLFAVTASCALACTGLVLATAMLGSRGPSPVTPLPEPPVPAPQQVLPPPPPPAPQAQRPPQAHQPN